MPEVSAKQVQRRIVALDAQRGPNVIATDLNWQNPVVLFSVPGALNGQLEGVTYDPTNNSLSISPIATEANISEYSLTGTLLSSFSTGGLNFSALAFDPADGTLWASLSGTNLLYQYSTSVFDLRGASPNRNTEYPIAP